MATPSGQFERSKLEAHVCALVRELLEESGSGPGGAAERLAGSARLAQDLGLGSLERVELLLRLERVFGIRLAERSIAEAESLDEVIAAVGAALGQAPGQERGQEQGAAASPAEAERRPAPGLVPPISYRPGARESIAACASAETWQQILEYRARVNAGEPHLMIYEGEGEPRTVTFDELFAGAQAVAESLAARGIGRGDSVALMLPTGRDFFLSFAGVLLAGGVPVPIYPPVRADRIAEYAQRQSAILRNAEARLLITFEQAARAARLLGPQVPTLRGIAAAPSLQPSLHKDEARRTPPGPRPKLPRSQPDDLALLQYTSGSTDDPKGVQLTNRNLLASVRAMGEAIEAGPGDVCVSWLPLYHDMGLIGMWLAPLYYGLPVAVLSPVTFLIRPESWLIALHKHRGTLTAAPNFAYELAARKVEDSAIAGIDLRSVRAMMNGAEPVSPETLERFAARFAPYGLRREALAPVYGLAEASLGVAIPPPGRGLVVDRVERETFEREGRAVPAGSDAEALGFVSVGRALPKHEVRIVDEHGREAGERREGTLWFRGPSTTRGYFRNEPASEALFPEGREAGWLTSGDRAYRAGGEFYITGRVKDIILKGGRNLYPQEIEEVAARVPGVRKGCVVAFGAPDPASGTERLVIVAETREPSRSGGQRPKGAHSHEAHSGDSPSPEQIRSQITEQVASAIGIPPDAIELVPPRAIPKTSSGKLRRSQSRQRYLAGTLRQTPPPAWVQVGRLAASSGVRRVAQAVTGGLRRAGEVLYGLYAWLVFAAVVLTAWVAIQFVRTRQGAARVTVTALRILLPVIGLRVRVEGREHLKTPPPVVFVCNHTSNIDVIVLMAALGADYHFVAKEEIASWPFFRTFLRKMGHFSFDRSDPRARMRQSEQILEALRRGESVFIFPEGTFTREPGVREFQLGAFKAAAYAGCPIVPIALRGTRRFLRDRTYLPRPSRIAITVSPPIRPKKTTEWREIVALRDAARREIHRETGEPLL